MFRAIWCRRRSSALLLSKTVWTRHGFLITLSWPQVFWHFESLLNPQSSCSRKSIRVPGIFENSLAGEETSRLAKTDGASEASTRLCRSIQRGLRNSGTSAKWNHEFQVALSRGLLQIGDVSRFELPQSKIIEKGEYGCSRPFSPNRDFGRILKPCKPLIISSLSNDLDVPVHDSPHFSNAARYGMGFRDPQMMQFQSSMHANHRPRHDRSLTPRSKLTVCT